MIIDERIKLTESLIYSLWASIKSIPFVCYSAGAGWITLHSECFVWCFIDLRWKCRLYCRLWTGFKATKISEKISFDFGDFKTGIHCMINANLLPSWTKGKNILCLVQMSCSYFLAFSSVNLLHRRKLLSLFNKSTQIGVTYPLCVYPLRHMHIYVLHPWLP